MPFEIMLEQSGAYRRFYGFVTASEFEQSIKNLHNELRFDTLKYSIDDFLGVQGHEITKTDITMLIALGIGASFSNPDIRIATVTNDEGIMGFMQSYASFQLKPSHFEIFPSIAHARIWIKGEVSLI